MFGMLGFGPGRGARELRAGSIGLVWWALVAPIQHSRTVFGLGVGCGLLFGIVAIRVTITVSEPDTHKYIYIYIDRERDRERERMGPCVSRDV